LPKCSVYLRVIFIYIHTYTHTHTHTYTILPSENACELLRKTEQNEVVIKIKVHKPSLQ